MERSFAIGREEEEKGEGKKVSVSPQKLYTISKYPYLWSYAAEALKTLSRKLFSGARYLAETLVLFTEMAKSANDREKSRPHLSANVEWITLWLGSSRVLGRLFHRTYFTQARANISCRINLSSIRVYRMRSIRRRVVRVPSDKCL